MRQVIRRYSKSLIVSSVFSAMSSLSILFCIILQNTDTGSMKKWLAIVLIFEQLFFWRANQIRKMIESSGKYGKARGRPGILSFFQNRVGTISDVLFGLSLLSLIILMVLHIGESAIQFLLIALLVLTFRFHCIFNGKNFPYKNYLEKRKVINNE